MVTRSASSLGSLGPSEGGYGSVTTAAARPRRRKQPCPSQVRSTWSSPPSIRRCRSVSVLRCLCWDELDALHHGQGGCSPLRVIWSWLVEPLLKYVTVTF